MSINNIKTGNLSKVSPLLKELMDDEKSWEIIKSDIDNIEYLNNDLTECIDSLNKEILNEDDIELIQEIFHRYIEIFSNIVQFESFIDLIDSLREIIESFGILEKGIKDANMVIVVNVLKDLKSFINKLFILQEDIDYFYYRNNLEANVAQIKTNLGMKEGYEVDLF